jgi:hypothetical protein
MRIRPFILDDRWLIALVKVSEPITGICDQLKLKIWPGGIRTCSAVHDTVRSFPFLSCPISECSAGHKKL